MMIRLLKGLERLYLQVCDPIPAWDLNLVLSRLAGPPFELLSSCSLLLLSWKVSFLEAITSARQVSEIRVLMSEPRYTVFYKDQVQLPYLRWCRFHNNQDIFLPVFFPKPHKTNEECQLQSLDVLRALSFYIERTKSFCKST